MTDQPIPGWQEAALPTAVSISAGTTYVVSYYTSNGQYARDVSGLASAVVSGNLRKTFRQMWDLFTRFRWGDTPALFTNELMIALCWEESTFMNIWQVGKNGG